ncbi:hypothetical protein L1987_75883 [Smallanthus sonchifolius]|uniref:Uncharacterized protein n=1 Tax=Smallanthus sonchifolius TaxID=185202 RepID=A0ACB9A5Z2_9ASTR|nr:hypothetical protein L1987_75883 [Smallanthus sonchifolius]
MNTTPTAVKGCEPWRALRPCAVGVEGRDVSDISAIHSRIYYTKYGNQNRTAVIRSNPKKGQKIPSDSQVLPPFSLRSPPPLSLPDERMQSTNCVILSY